MSIDYEITEVPLSSAIIDYCADYCLFGHGVGLTLLDGTGNK